MDGSVEQVLEELYTTDDLIKKAIAELTAKKDYKTLNTLFRRNTNASKFDTRSLNEDIPQKNKRFTKQNGKLCNVTKSTPRTTPHLDSVLMYCFIINPQSNRFNFVILVYNSSSMLTIGASHIIFFVLICLVI